MNQKMLMFSYGMNTNCDSMRDRCPESVNLGPALLLDHELEFAHHCNVKSRPGFTVPGLLWEITDWDLASLDVTEGYPYYYNRVGAAVEHLGKRKLALVYTMMGATEIAPPTEYYLELVTSGYRQNQISERALKRALNNCYELSNI